MRLVHLDSPNLFFLLLTAYRLRLTLFRFEWQPCVAPRVDAADENVEFREIVLFENERRTGAGVLVVSSAVGDDGSPTRHFADARLQFAAPDANAVRDLHVALRPVFRVARVEEDGRAPRQVARPLRD
jgi:hypothetical protein